MNQLPLIPFSVPSLSDLRARAENCHACRLHTTRTKVVFGSGATGQLSVLSDALIEQRIAADLPQPSASRVPLAIVGEAPGQQEDQTGEPFVGASGRLLDKMLAAMCYGRSEVYLLNSLCCRPPKNRDPEKDELKACSGFLEDQLLNVRPLVILALGAVAARALIETQAAVGHLRGRWWSWREIPVRVTYHPAALLRDESLKKPTWEDLKEVLSFITAAPRSV